MIMEAEKQTFKPAPMTPPRSPPGPEATAGGLSPAHDAPAISTRDLSVFFGEKHVLKHVSLDIGARAVTAIIGPSGCGKSTFLRSLNRMHELVPTARIEGQIRLFGQDIHQGRMEAVQVRRRIG